MNVPVRQAFIGLGANLGDRIAALEGAASRLRATPGVVYLENSSVYVTDPVGLTEQPQFLNRVVGIETTLDPEALLIVLQEIEHAFGRERTVRWGPRTLDLDLLAFEREVRTTPHLTLPHPRMFERDFVRVPLRELLEHERFRRGQWDALRAQLGPIQPASGVWRYRVGTAQ